MYSVQEALEYVRGVHARKTPYAAGTYRSACEALVAQRNDLTESVYIQLPGGMGGNNDSSWDTVRVGSEERCGCGNERVIRPGNLRTIFEASDADPVVISPGQKVYLKPVGGDKSSVYIKLAVESGAMTFLNEPFAPIFSMDVFSTQGYPLSTLAEVLPKEQEPPKFVIGKTKQPILTINAVDLGAQTVTITLDRAVEAFDPDADDGHEHRHE